MKITLSTADAADYLRPYGYTSAARIALVEYYEQLEEDTNEEIDLDPATIACEWAEYSSPKKWAEEFFAGTEKAMEALDCRFEDLPQKALDYLRDSTQIIDFDGGLLVLDF